MRDNQKPSGCRRCWEEESAGKESLRQRHLRDIRFRSFGETEALVLRSLELALSNECNLACRMCDSRYSRRWFDFETEIFGKTFASQKILGVNLTEIQDSLRDVRILKITGGEPLVTTHFLPLLRWLNEENLAAKMEISFVTNCTLEPSAELLKWLAGFESVDITLSLDSIDAREWEYIRWPSRVSKALKNVGRFMGAAAPGWRIGIRPTVSILNIATILPTLIWFKKKTAGAGGFFLNPTHLSEPSFLGLTVLPREKKQAVRKLLEAQCRLLPDLEIEAFAAYLIEHMLSADRSGELGRLQEYLTQTDRQRGQNFATSYPHYADLFAPKRPLECAFDDESEKRR